jgi:superfamily II DNA helicase RecQ
VQETGRAGRDGEESTSILYFSPTDAEWCGRIAKGHEKARVGAMIDYSRELRCRRAELLGYFGEREGRCKSGRDVLCDVCADAGGVRTAMAASEKRRDELVRPLSLPL